MIEFGQVKPQLLILLIYPVGIILARLITMYYIANPLFYLFLFFISHFLALIPLMIYKIRKIIHKNRKKKQEELDNNDNSNKNLPKKSARDIINQIVKLKEKIQSKVKRDKILNFLLIGILYFSTFAFFLYFNYIVKSGFYGNISMVTEVVYFSAFNWLILGNAIYSHHFFSMIIITISIISIYIILFLNFIQNNDNWEAWKDFIFPTLLNFIAYCPFCFFLVKGKSYIEKYFVSSYELIVYLGLFCLFLLIIFEPISFYIPCNNEIICFEGHIAGIISGIRQTEGISGVLYCLGISFCFFMAPLGLWLTVRDLSPCHFLTSDSIITVELNILIDCYNEEIVLLKNPLFYIFSFFTIFACLIYNEIITITFCKLNYYTKKEIIKRQSKDIKQINFELPDYLSTETLCTNDTIKN